MFALRSLSFPPMPILVLQHHDIGTTGRLGLTLRDNGHRLDIRRPDRHGEAALPPDLDGVDGVVVMGGPQNVDEHLAAPGSTFPWMRREMDILRDAHKAQLPIIGVCLGHQILAAALGGEVSRMDAPTCGFRDVLITPPGQTDPILAGIRWRWPQFLSHQRHVSKAPAGASVIASAGDARMASVQAYRIGLRAYSFQFHFELDRDGVEAHTRADAESGALSRAGLTLDEVMKQADSQYAEYARLSDRLCVNLVSLLTPPEFRDSARHNMPEGPASVVNVR